MKFMAILHQDGGCDYTIGCGIAVVELNSTTHDDAVTELRNKFFGEDVEFSLDEIESAAIYAVSEDAEIDLNAWRAERMAEAKAAADLDRDAREREEFERLSKKYAKR